MEQTKFKWSLRERSQEKTAVLEYFTEQQARRVQRFHSSFPEYQPTPLRALNELARQLGIKNLFVKDEAYRFGLNAFKVLGGSFAIGSYIADELQEDIDKLPYSRLISDEIRKCFGTRTFITTTDGNHGRGVAWTANRLGQRAVVYMPQGSAAERLANIRAEGAVAELTEMNYDETVRYTSNLAQKNGWIIVQDTAWEDYTQIPLWIMQGYMTMALEAYEQMPVKPTHIFLQAGVGSMAGAVQGFFANVYGSACPLTFVVEPDKADCLYQTAAANDGQLHNVTGSLDTIMAGLACGEPNSIAWEILGHCSDGFISCPDYTAAQGMRILGNPLAGDRQIVAGESGAATVGLVTEVLRDQRLEELKQALLLDENSVVLCFNTEGATDKANYRRIVWDGAWGQE
ncbi:diaminopropionate ammonia-lyase [uncultured Phascolarctobacterium sp.]|uniref:diaminopropionate ammonia-lyase n=1 Tax=uncultured Phascolarctobacterium sp. TaxID=512296 RepID=UPI0025DDAFF8|nr:diaminopropionate ammonia-lyase [uncultured Phascolarctobacterium sp.]